MEVSSSGEISKKASHEVDLDITELIRSHLRGVAPVATAEDLKNPKELIPILSTRRFRTPRKLFYRTLFIDTSKELVLIISPNLSIAIARIGLSELKTLAIQIQEGIPQDLPVGARIYLEYQLLHEKYGWTFREINEQITYDFLVALLMMHTQGKDPYSFREYGGDFVDAILDYLRVPSSQRQAYLNHWMAQLDEGKLPITPDSGMIIGNIIKSMPTIHHVWKKELTKSLVDQAPVGYLLLGFWIVGIQFRYWASLDYHHDLKSYNQVHRKKLISQYLEQLIENYSDLGIPRVIPRERIEEFLQEVRQKSA